MPAMPNCTSALSSQPGPNSNAFAFVLRVFVFCICGLWSRKSLQQDF